MRQTFQTALDDLGRTLGIADGLPLSSDGTAAMTLDDIEVQIGHIESSDTVQFYAIIGTMPEEPSVNYLTTLLAANNLQKLSDGGAIGYDQPDGNITLNLRLPADYLTAQVLPKELEKFVNLVEAWRGQIEALDTMDRAYVAENRDDGPGGPGGAGGSDESWIRL